MTRRGITRTGWMVVFVLAAMAGLAIVYAVNKPQQQPAQKPTAAHPAAAQPSTQPATQPAVMPTDGLLIYVGGSMQKPMERIVAAYREKTGIRITPSYGDSGEVLTQVQRSGMGEAAVLHEPYVTLAEKEGWSVATHQLAFMQPVIAVAKGNPKNIKGLRDFARDDLRVGLTDARHTISGQIVQQALANAGIGQAVMARQPYQNKSSGHMAMQVMGGDLPAPDGRGRMLAMYGAGLILLAGAATVVWRSSEKVRPAGLAGVIFGLVLVIGGLVSNQQPQAAGGALDAATLWDAVAAGHPEKLEIIQIEQDLIPATFTDTEGVSYADGRVGVGLFTLKTAKHPDQTSKFIEFILSPDGQRIWKQAGFNPIRPTQ